MGTTRETLVEHLQAKPQSPERDAIIERAKAGVYHDFDSELDAPKMALFDELRRAGLQDLAQATVDGAYDDEEPSPEQLEEMREQLGPETFDRMFGKS